MTDNTTAPGGDELLLIVSSLMLDVMRLRNTYKYDLVAPKAMNDEMDVAYHKAVAALQAYILAEVLRIASDVAHELQSDAVYLTFKEKAIARFGKGGAV